MTQDEIISMAREAGFEVNYYKSLESEEVVSFDPIITYNLECFAALVAAHEREKCALVCITLGEYYAECDDFEAEDVAHACASSIMGSEK